MSKMLIVQLSLPLLAQTEILTMEHGRLLQSQTSRSDSYHNRMLLTVPFYICASRYTDYNLIICGNIISIHQTLLIT